MEPQITANSFFATTSTTTSPQLDASPTTVFFISGNPGLIGYYHIFLSLLSSYLRSPSTHGDAKRISDFDIYGASLGGFEVQSRNEKDDDGRIDGGRKTSKLYSLEQQIQFVEGKLEAFMDAKGGLSAKTSGESRRPRVILVGHSVGGYIAMEILRRHRDKYSHTAFDIVGGILLFPTVMDIASSPAGKKLTRLLYFIHRLLLLVSLLTSILTSIVPDFALRHLIALAMGSPPNEALETTLAFIKSGNGVRQALHMAADEMRDITTDKWNDEIWGIRTLSSSTDDSQTQKLNKLVFYFGRNDHWVAEQTRDDIMAMKDSSSNGRSKGPKMVVCEEGLPHAFCIRHNDIMARKVADFVREILVE